MDSSQSCRTTTTSGGGYCGRTPPSPSGRRTSTTASRRARPWRGLGVFLPPDHCRPPAKSSRAGENGEMYIFQRLSATEKSIADVPVEQLKAKQADLEVSLVKIIIAQDPYPVPGRALRNCVARCFITLYTRGETRTLFDTFQDTRSRFA
ncbi:hypothetical protein C8J57DRAFT_143030 [Mycena rebaudengoi]|nr:hypothetical protein C8J57DRAFT_143030 [Mycena rebaudengoi]